MYEAIQTYINHLTEAFESIPIHRKEILEKITEYIRSKQEKNQPISLLYICTHNSRRSHYGQIWAHVASSLYSIKNVAAYSGGTEATSFNDNAIKALKRIGFRIQPSDELENSKYEVFYDAEEKPIECFSKVYYDHTNPQNNFAAIMTCSEAESNCPLIPGADIRIGTPYEDPKLYDDTAQQDEMYDARCRQIALETLYVFSKL
jgi:protein-tyrosine phosphatase/arsenate reductase